jgi:2-amino-4-hydroxy-6-hydroxymethyldihydropteridine diphosphokinase
MIRCYIALGSNLGAPLRQVDTAIVELGRLPDSVLVKQSSWYRSRPIGPAGQPDYINGVAALDTNLAPLKLLHRMQAIENAHGRQREERWGPRTLDLDLLLYGELETSSAELTLPHPRLGERNFVLLPLAEIAPDLVLPCGTPLGSLLDRCPREGIERWQHERAQEA